MDKKKENIFSKIFGGGFGRNTSGTMFPLLRMPVTSTRQLPPTQFTAPSGNGRAFFPTPTGSKPDISSWKPPIQNTGNIYNNNGQMVSGDGSGASNPVNMGSNYQNNGGVSPYDAFNLLLQDSLKKAQGIDNTELLKQQRVLQRESIARSQGKGMQATEEELKFLSPSQQKSIQSAQVGAVSPDLDEIAYQITKSNQDRQNLMEQINSARQMGNDSYERALKAQDRALDQQVKALEMEKTRLEMGKIRAETTKIGSETTGTQGGSSETLDYLNLTNTLLNNPDLKRITGVLQGKIGGQFLGGGQTGLAKNQFSQLKGILSLENRQKLKGSGAISDFEARTLERAASALGRNLPDAQFIEQIKQIRGAFATSAGLEADVLVTNPQTGEIAPGKLDRNAIDSAISQGFMIQYN